MLTIVRLTNDLQLYFSENYESYQSWTTYRRSIMNRRKVITSTGAVGLLAANRLAEAAPKVVLAKPVLMKVGDQTAPTNETHLKYLARYSVRNICGYPQ